MLPPKDVYLIISKLHSILAVANFLAHINIIQICYGGQISLQSAAVNCSFSDNQTPLGVTFILLAMDRSFFADVSFDFQLPERMRPIILFIFKSCIFIVPNKVSG